MKIIGPDFSNLVPYRANLSGTRFSFKTPKHNHPRIPENPNDEITDNIYNEKRFSQFPSSDERELFCRGMEHINWVYWSRRFLLLTKEVGTVNLVSKVIHLKEFSSLFQKSNFEYAVERLLFSHGDSFASTGLCRLNWRIKNYNGTSWVAFENDGLTSSRGLYSPCKSVLQSFYLTPISDEHMLAVFFTQVEYLNAPDISSEFEKLREKVMSTAELTLSEESIKQQQEVESQCPDQKYSKNLPPYEFDLLPLPTRDDAHDQIMEAKGVDAVNSMSESAYSKAIDEIEAENKRKYYEQVNQILASHLRFKKNNRN